MGDSFICKSISFIQIQLRDSNAQTKNIKVIIIQKVNLIKNLMNLFFSFLHRSIINRLIAVSNIQFIENILFMKFYCIY
jgi:hypothetical protein